MTALYIVGESGCWIWQGGVNNQGYGFWGRQLAHRRMYELLVGPIPDGLEIDHVRDQGCVSTLCVNPDHLEPVTHLENVRRGNAGRINRARMLARTHCKRGHPFSPENTSTINGYRRCLRCAADAAKARYHRVRIDCADCGRNMPPAARGLCGACYQRVRGAVR